MNSFLDEDDVVQDFPSLDESTLIIRNNFGQNPFKSGGNDLGDDLIPCIAQGDRSEAVEVIGTFFLRYQS